MTAPKNDDSTINIVVVIIIIIIIIILLLLKNGVKSAREHSTALLLKILSL